MSLTAQTKRRLPTIKQMLLKGNNYETIGKACGVTEKTIDRDVSDWYKSGEYETWLFQEWVRLHAEVLKEDCVEPYRQVSKLIAKMVTRKAEIKTESTLTEHKEVSVTVKLRDYEKEIRRAVERDFSRHNTKQPLPTTQTDNKTG